MVRSAIIDKTGVYRYLLERTWAPLMPRRCCFVMLNPSTADALIDDPTIRRCIRFAKREGFTAMSVVNLFAFRATYPEQLGTAADPVGPENDDYIARETGRPDCELIIAAWGASGGIYRDRCRKVAALIRRPIFCLGLTAAGYPRHPLYLPADAELQAFGSVPA